MPGSNKKFLDPDTERHFPNLTRDLYEVKSEKTWDYNCIAFAAGDDSRWWEPDQTGQYYWPSGVPRLYTVDAFIKMFESLGYEKCQENVAEPNVEKIAIYITRLGNPDAPRGSPTHAALQQNGVWKSKLGPYEDIEHLNLDCLSGEDISGRTQPYGETIQILKRKRP